VKALRPDQPWRPQRAIPAGDRNELRRAAEEMRKANRGRVEEMIAEARARGAALLASGRADWGQASLSDWLIGTAFWRAKTIRASRVGPT
jgi:hypothetical protein